MMTLATFFMLKSSRVMGSSRAELRENSDEDCASTLSSPDSLALLLAMFAAFAAKLNVLRGTG